MDADEVKLIEARMREISAAAIPFVKRVIPVEEAGKFFEGVGRMDRFHAIGHRSKPYVTIYSCGGFEDYFYGYMAPDTGYIKVFSLKFLSARTDNTVPGNGGYLYASGI